jgi:hypothetical protein
LRVHQRTEDPAAPVRHLDRYPGEPERIGLAPGQRHAERDLAAGSHDPPTVEGDEHGVELDVEQDVLDVVGCVLRAEAGAVEVDDGSELVRSCVSDLTRTVGRAATVQISAPANWAL